MIGLGYNEQTHYLKKVNANYHKAPVLALGTSRVMQFREFAFTEDFYNCGGAVFGNYHEYRNFLQNLTYSPDILLLGLDCWVFNESWSADRTLYYDAIEEIEQEPRDKAVLVQAIRDDWKKGKWSFGDLFHHGGNIGFNGKVRGDGFAYDGSYTYGEIIKQRASGEPIDFSNTIERIRNGNSRFEWGDCVWDETKRQLEDLLRYCEENDIYVVAFMCPFAPSVYAEMIGSGNYEYIDAAVEYCETIFPTYGYEFYNFVDGSAIVNDDEYYVDGFHGGEIVYAKMLIDMCEQDSILNGFVDAKALKGRVNQSTHPLCLSSKPVGESYE